MGNWNWFWRKQECCETDFPDQLVAKYRNTLHSFPSNRPTGFGIIFKRNTRWSGRIKSFYSSSSYPRTSSVRWVKQLKKKRRMLSIRVENCPTNKNRIYFPPRRLFSNFQSLILVPVRTNSVKIINTVVPFQLHVLRNSTEEPTREIEGYEDPSRLIVCH